VASAADALRAEISASGGAIPFRRFMELSLYGDGGFYSGVGSAGRRGDFITSPEVGPLFGTVLARALDSWWMELGSPEDFTVVEAAAGPGTLARAILAAKPECLRVGRYVAVEVSATQRARHPEGIESRATMPDQPVTGVVLANELLDNLPFDLAVFDAGWREAWVAINGGRFVEVLRPFVETPSILPVSAPHGARAPIQRVARDWLRDALRLVDRGRILIFDYCTPLTLTAVTSPWREWLRTYAQHERGGHYLANPGEQDITTQVMLDQLDTVAEPESLRTQAQFLQLWGIDELVEEGRVAWEAAAARPDLAAMRMRSRISEAAALLDPTGLGGFSALTYRID
jgi:SAM-dependent MidA family methyltransferase